MTKRLLRAVVLAVLAFPLVQAGTALAAQVPVRTAMTGSTLLEIPAKLQVRDVALIDALDALERSAQVSLAYSPGLLPAERRVTCECRESTLGAALGHILQGTGLRYTTVRQQVLIEPIQLQLQVDENGPAPRFASLVDLAPVGAPSLRQVEAFAGTVSGRVTSAANGAPLSGAQVAVVGTSLGATTGSLSSPPEMGIPSTT